jgi:hypothetical protein
VAAHYAISSVFTSYPEQTCLFGYSVQRLDLESLNTGRGRLLIGRALVSSTITGESEPVTYAVLHFGDQNITAAVKRCPDASDAADGAKLREEHQAFVAASRAAVNRADIPAVIRLFDRYFGEKTYSINSLFNDEERRILKIILEPTLGEIETTFSAIYERHASLLEFLSQTGLPKPSSLTLAAGYSINSRIRQALEADPVEDESIRLLLGKAKDIKIGLDEENLSYIAAQRIKRAMVLLNRNPGDMALLDQAIAVAQVLRAFSFDIRLWQAQNIWYEILEMSRQKTFGLSYADFATWLTRLNTLGRHLGIAVDELVVEDDGVPLIR